MSDSEQINWNEVEEAASKMFSVWIDGCELDWAKEAWGHLGGAGLTSRQSVLDETAAKLRIVTLAKIYHEFCGLAWDEDPETPIAYLAQDLQVDPVAIGVLAGATGPNTLEEAIEEYELYEEAVIAVTDRQRKELFECLKSAYGDEFRLYSRIWHTRSALAEADSEGDEFEVTDANATALEYVRNGFRR
jgi:hypothetical protein